MDGLLHQAHLAEQGADLGTQVSAHVVREWLAHEGLALHRFAKVLAGGHRLTSTPSSAASPT